MLLLLLLLLLCLGQHIFPILRLSSAHGVRQMTVEMIARRIEGVRVWAEITVGGERASVGGEGEKARRRQLRN